MAGETVQAGADVVAAAFLCLPGQIGIRNEGGGADHIVQLALGNPLLHHPRIGAGAHRAHRDVQMLFDLGGLLHILAFHQIKPAGVGEVGGLGIMERAGGDMDQIHPVGLQQLAELDALLQAVALGETLHPGNPGFNDEVGAAVLADAVHHHAGQPGPVFQTAAELVGALVEDGGEELGQQPAVAGMEQHRLETAVLGAVSGFAVGLHHLLDDLLGHGDDLVGALALAVALVHGIDAITGAVVDAVVVMEMHAGVVQLQSRHRAVGADLRGQRVNARFSPVLPQVELLAPIHCAGLVDDAVAQRHRRCAAAGPPLHVFKGVIIDVVVIG